VTHLVIIPREIVSGNTLAYRHWRRRMAERDYWIVAFVSLAQRVPRAACRRAVRVTAYRKRRVDEDNLSSGFKHGRDAMVRVGLLIDDNKAGCRFVYEDCRILSEMPADLVKKYGRVPLTVVEILDLTESPEPKEVKP
jgi:hypothetical protein